MDGSVQRSRTGFCLTGRHAVGNCRANHAGARCLLDQLILGPPASGLVFFSLEVFSMEISHVLLYAIQSQSLAFAERTPDLVFLLSLPTSLATE